MENINANDINSNELELWESGVLGDLNNAIIANSDINPSKIETKPYSIRMPISLMDSIKQIAILHEISYQSLIRDILTRFATSEMQYLLKKEIEKNIAERNQILKEKANKITEEKKLRVA